MILSGCGPSNKVVTTDGKTISLPPAPAGLSAPCPRPKIAEGDSVRSALNKSTAALSKCEDRRRGWGTFYEDVRNKYKPLG